MIGNLYAFIPEFSSIKNAGHPRFLDDIWNAILKRQEAEGCVDCDKIWEELDETLAERHGVSNYSYKLGILKEILKESDIIVLNDIIDNQDYIMDLSWAHYKQMIDPLFQQLVIDLNRAGFVTGGSCQGRRSLYEKKQRRHGNYACMSVENGIPSSILCELRKNLIVYGEDKCFMANVWPDHMDDLELCIAENNLFEDRVRKAFGLN